MKKENTAQILHFLFILSKNKEHEKEAKGRVGH